MTKEIALKYGCNPNQKPARIYLNDQELPQDIQVPQALSMLVLQVPQLAHHLARWKEKSILQVMKNYLCLHVRM